MANTQRKHLAKVPVGGNDPRGKRPTAAQTPSAAHSGRRKLKTVDTIKHGDKLFLVTRRDIEPGYQAVQSCHAMRQFTADHPEIDAEWFKGSNYLALLSAENEIELMRLLVFASDAKIRWSAFREPDVGGSITAIALEPSPQAAALCKELPLALKEIRTKR